MATLPTWLIAVGVVAIAGCGTDSTVGPSGPSGTTGSAGGHAGAGGVANGGMGGVAGGGTGGVAGAGGMGGAGGIGGAGGSGGAAGMGGAGGVGGAVASTSSSGTGGQGGQGGANCGAPADDAVISHAGQAGTVLLRGMVLTPDTAFAGEVLVESDTITCVAASCASVPAAANASIVETHGIILPGLIDAHNHVLFDIFDERQWTPAAAYTNHTQWVKEPKYDAMLDVKQYLNGEGSSPVDFGCELDKYGELKGLVGGSTSIIGHTGLGRSCYGSLTRTIEQSQNGLAADKIQVSALFPPSVSSADGVCNNFVSQKTAAYLIHCGEGTDGVALAEFAKLGTVTTADDCLYAPQTALVHATAFGDPELTIMAQHGMSLVWSPRVNVFLYGGGVDLTKGPNIPLALAKGINVALGADWSLGGCQNLLDEMRFANHVDDATFGDILTSKMIVQMATRNGAKALALDAVLGSLEVGKKADILVIGGDAANPYDAVLAATPYDVRLVMVGGAALYGDPSLSLLAPPSPGCEAIDICCRSKFLCVALPGGTPTNKFGQTFADIQSTLATALSDYDAMHLSQWTWSPMTPLVRCP